MLVKFKMVVILDHCKKWCLCYISRNPTVAIKSRYLDITLMHAEDFISVFVWINRKSDNIWTDPFWRLIISACFQCTWTLRYLGRKLIQYDVLEITIANMLSWNICMSLNFPHHKYSACFLMLKIFSWNWDQKLNEIIDGYLIGLIYVNDCSEWSDSLCMLG